MVKKIKMVDDEEVTQDDLDTLSYQKQMLEYHQAMDWKLWELLKIAKAIAERDNLFPPREEPAPDYSTQFKSIILEDDDDDL